MQLDLFNNDITDYPFHRQPNKAEADVLNTVFNGADYIAHFLGDITELYHFRQWTRCGWPWQILWTIGASIRKDGMFYFYEVETGSIYLLNNFSTFPYKPKEDEKIIMERTVHHVCNG